MPQFSSKLNKTLKKTTFHNMLKNMTCTYNFDKNCKNVEIQNFILKCALLFLEHSV